MLRLVIAAALIALGTSAFAQDREVKDIKFGEGCIKPVTTFGPRLGTCMIQADTSRIWCPSGKIFERTEKEPRSSYVVRSICGLNQVL
jgi:hypothetical protein